MGRRAAKLVAAVLVFVCTASLLAAANGDLPDLAVREMRVEPTTAYRGTPIAVSVTLSTSGPLPPDQMVVLEMAFRRSDLEEECCAQRVEIESPGPGPVLKTYSVDTSDLSPGRYELYFRIDPDNAIAESSESNNRMMGVVTVVSTLPDLVPTSLQLVPGSPVEVGSTLRVSTRITNTGSNPASTFVVTCEVAAYGDAGLIDWTQVGTAQIAGLGRDDAADADFTFAAAGEGRYAVRIRADSAESVLESDEMNNELATSFSTAVNPRQLPDLRPTAITLSPPSPLGWLTDAVASVDIINSGGSSTQAVPVQVAFYYRRVGTGSANWIPLKRQGVLREGLEGADADLCDPENWAIMIQDGDPLSIELGSNSETIELSIGFAQEEQGRVCGDVSWPARIVPGEYELQVRVDPGDAIAEQDESNNSLIIGFSILGSELVPEGIELSQATVERGTNVVVRSSIRNTGMKTVDSFTVGFFVDAILLDTFYYQGQGLGTQDVVVVQGQVSTQDLIEGQEHLVRVVVDPDNRIYEADESNNVIAAPLSVHGLPERRAELHVNQILLDPPSPIAPGLPFRVRAALSNSGDLAAEGFDIILIVARESGSQDVSDADPFGTTGWLPVAELATSVPRLAPNETRWFEWTIAADHVGRHRAIVAADTPEPGFTAYGQVLERDETNNRMAGEFNIGIVAAAGQDPSYPQGSGEANLALRDVSIQPATLVDVGTTLQYSAAVANLGGEATGPFDVRVRWGLRGGASVIVGSQRIAGLAAGEVRSIGPISIQTSLPMGQYEIVAEADVLDEVSEQNETDNESQTVVIVGDSVTLLPDLAPIAVRFVPASGQVEIGHQLYAYVAVRNLGTLASGPFGVSFATSAGTAYEAWGSLEPLQETEIAYAWRPGTEGDDTLTITIDYADAVDEADEENNTTSASYSVVLPDVAVAEGVVQGDAAVTHLLADAATGKLHAAWASGRLAIINPDGSTESLIEPEAGVMITSLRMVDGSQPAAYFGTSIGTVAKLDLASGEILHEAFLMTEPIRALYPTASGRLLAATEQRLVVLDAAFNIVAQVTTDGGVLHLGYDEIGDAFYVVTTTGLYAFDATLTPLCQSSSYVGTPTVLTVGTSGVFIGTEAGAVYAFSFCTSQGGSLFAMLDSWRYPRVGSFGGAVVSIVVDPRDLDPVYVSDGSGTLHALSLTGDLLWSYSGSQDVPTAFSSILTIEPRAGRVLIGDAAGRPYVFDSEGDAVFAVDSTASAGSAIVSDFAVTEARVQTEAGTRLVRSYFYGTQDGWIYRFDSQR